MSKLIDSQMIGKTIKFLRKVNNLTQEQLADMVGYSVRNIRRIENYGTTSIDVVNTFADIFKVSAIDILQGCLYFFTNKKNIGSLHHTMFTLICYSYTCTLGWAISSDLITSRMDLRRTMEGTWLSFNFQRASASVIFQLISWPSPTCAYQTSYRWLLTIKPNTSFENVVIRFSS